VFVKGGRAGENFGGRRCVVEGHCSGIVSSRRRERCRGRRRGEKRERKYRGLGDDDRPGAALHPEA